MERTVTTADCERVQAHWFRTRAAVLGGRAWQDGPLEWLDGPDGLRLMFPPEIPAAELARAVADARARGAGIGVWLGLEVDAAPLADAGFERGWSPWWMTAPAAAIGAPGDPRVALRPGGQDDSQHGQDAAMTAERPQHTWYASAHVDGALAGRARAHLHDGLAGVFDMDVWPRFQRRGLGTALLREVCAATDASDAVLNATPEGRLLYEQHGFRMLGEGITWWLHA